MRVLTWNIQQIPSVATKAYPAGRDTCQQKLVSQFNVTMMQEAFLNTDSLRSGSSWSWLPIFKPGKKLLGHIDRKFRSPGLLARTDQDAEIVSVTPFKKCAGLFNHHNDCLAQKGVQVFKMGDITYVNVHWDAGPTRKDQRARDNHMGISFAAVPKTGKVVFAGDVNINSNRPEEYARLYAELANHNLTVVQHSKNDIIAVRDVAVLQSGVINDETYSDHKPVYAYLDIPPPPVEALPIRIALNVP